MLSGMLVHVCDADKSASSVTIVLEFLNIVCVRDTTTLLIYGFCVQLKTVAYFFLQCTIIVNQCLGI